MQGFLKLMTGYSELSKKREKEPKRFNALKSLRTTDTGLQYRIKVLQKKNFVNDMKIVYLYCMFEFLLYRNIFDYTEIDRTQ